MDREVRGDVVRYAERRRALSALMLAGTVPMVVAGWMSGQPAFMACGAPLLLAALWAHFPIRTIDIHRAAGTLTLAAKGAPSRVFPLGEVRQVRAEGSAGRVHLWIDLSEGPLPAGRGTDVEAGRRQALKMSEDLGCPVDLRNLRQG